MKTSNVAESQERPIRSLNRAQRRTALAELARRGRRVPHGYSSAKAHNYLVGVYELVQLDRRRARVRTPLRWRWTAAPRPRARARRARRRRSITRAASDDGPARHQTRRGAL
jgi:hypothetical protein